ncbi:uncharacterized protein LMH87_009160 [Akanthomyces muscarius]|uniref:Uncharacterized protein n=1 Tax=Akanthomyces muscarius TaxID=2231603 RepID=A0A9W8QK45_AKAMU|nr:uncharacterized protein LMH87_009160 [Akanthomyces muscarius]KAJ4158644.1 hypothetical protein LMH87_009160 [Akanthomyces muscarius]
MFMAHANHGNSSQAATISDKSDNSMVIAASAADANLMRFTGVWVETSLVKASPGCIIGVGLPLSVDLSASDGSLHLQHPRQDTLDRPSTPESIAPGFELITLHHRHRPPPSELRDHT